MQEIFYFTYKLANILLLLTTLYALYKYINYKSTILLLLVIYLIVSTGVNFLVELNEQTFFLTKNNSHTLVHIFLVTHLITFIYIILYVLGWPKKKIHRVCLLSFILYVFIFFIEKQTLSFYLATAINCLLAFLSIISLFKRISQLKLTTISNEWASLILIGVSIFSFLNLPIILFFKELKKIISEKEFLEISIISPIASILFYLMIAYSIKCFTKKAI